MTSDEAGRGLLFIVSGPSGAGKTTISGAALRAFPNLIMSVSATTRRPRAGERDGIEYLFVDKDRFASMIRRNELAEWAQVHGHHYGTPRAPIERALERGQDVLLDIDVQGASQLRALYPGAVTVFVLPPDRSTMESRLRSRGTELEAVVRRRLENACREIARAGEYHHVIINRSREEAIAEFEAILRDTHRLGAAAMPRHRAGMSEAALASFLGRFQVEAPAA
ncbi:MAG TPA: guanylate kinase [Candidatus Binatia bacterium]